MICIHNARIVTPSHTIGGGWLLTDGERIAAYGPGSAPDVPDASKIDAQGRTLLPGFIDVHVHGGAGHDTMDANPEGLRAMAQFYARNGVTGFLATTWTDSHSRIDAAVYAIAGAVGMIEGGATLLGAHMEGPYLNVEKTGAQNPRHVRRADMDEVRPWLDMGIVRLIAVAPEFPENQTLIRECVRRGICVSAAHSSATYEELHHAVGLGLRQTTHTFNAMTGLHHREPGAVGAALTLPQLKAELIADNIHVHPVAMKFLWQMKGADGLIMITDAIRASGLPDGEYPVDERVMTVKDGACRLPDGTLAGSIITMNAAIRNLMAATSTSLEAIWPATSRTAARAIGLDHRTGSIAIGKDADLVLVDDDINVHVTIARGRIVYEGGQPA